MMHHLNTEREQKKEQERLEKEPCTKDKIKWKLQINEIGNTGKTLHRGTSTCSLSRLIQFYT
jgi:hypothetical protein